MSDSDPAEVTEADLAELERLEKAATAAPWEVRQDYYIGRPSRVHSLAEVKCGDVPAADTEQHKANAGVIAAARNALPKLLAEVRRERAARREGAEAGPAVEWVSGQPPQDRDYAVLTWRGNAWPPYFQVGVDGTGGGTPGEYHVTHWMRLEPPRPVEPDRATESERDRLVRERDAARDALGRIRDMVYGTKAIQWHDDTRTSTSRVAILDACDAALAQSGGGGGQP